MGNTENKKHVSGCDSTNTELVSKYDDTSGIYYCNQCKKNFFAKLPVDHVESVQEGTTKSNVIKVTVKSVYGIDKIYPACKASQAFASIACTKTLTEETIIQIKRIGFTVEVIAPTITL